MYFVAYYRVPAVLPVIITTISHPLPVKLQTNIEYTTKHKEKLVQHVMVVFTWGLWDPPRTSRDPTPLLWIVIKVSA